MNNRAPSSSAAFSSSANSANIQTGLDLEQLDAHLSEPENDFDDLVSKMDVLLACYTPPPDQANAYYRCLYNCLTDWDIDLDPDYIEDPTNYYRLLAELLQKYPPLASSTEGFEADLETFIENEKIQAIAAFGKGDESALAIGVNFEETWLGIIGYWQTIAKIHIAQNQPVGGFCESLDDALKGKFTNGAIGGALQGLRQTITDCLRKRQISANPSDPGTEP